ncbi:hypothetical protein IMSHALPRED_006324 [Imshaugia aleurites]|uniref:Zn(2)-C6 fungal-type domain-containing protein n=1 Tax=Imshaugia aleurites TaxID=172621 RepID=A0A8H3IEB4_9LECA|nr:hypothetical protein IMSHALPRED_006324 [Imshaugia aleurites]
MDPAYESRFPFQPLVDATTLNTSAPLPGLPIDPQHPPDSQERKRADVLHWETGATGSIREPTQGGRQSSASTEGKGVFGHHSSLRPLLPKLVDNSDAAYPLAPSPLSLQNPQHFAQIGARTDLGVATGSTGPTGLAQNGADHVGQESAATRRRGVRSQGHQDGAEGSTHPNPKIHIGRVQKPEKRRPRGPRTPVACENCRISRLKCTGEVPSCETCVRRGMQCGRYHTSRTVRREGQMATARENIHNFSVDANLQFSDQNGTSRQGPADRNGAQYQPVDEGLQQTIDTTEVSAFTSEVRDYPEESPLQ